MAATQVLLIEDVDKLGRSGEVVKVKAGFARNYLFPHKKGVKAEKSTLKLQERLQKERAKIALEDKKQSDEIAERLKGVILIARVKVDPTGHIYGSVSSADVEKLLQEQMNITVEKKSVQLKQPLKKLGVHNINIKLKENVMGSCTLKILSEDEIE